MSARERSSRSTRKERLEELSRRVAVCPLCPALVANRTRAVFGAGNPDADILLVGEAPGRQEDLRGEPFLGKAGGKLDELLASAGLSREDVYITNVVKCRPPANRTPHAGEIGNCRPYLDEQIALIRPRVLCALGGVAAESLTGIKGPLGRLRGRVHRYRDVPVFCTYHPAYVVRTRSSQPAAVDDLQQVRRTLGESPAEGRGTDREEAGPKAR